jgi:hypothetical protein
MNEFFTNAQDPEYEEMNGLVNDMLGNTTCGGSIDAQAVYIDTYVFILLNY